MLSPEKPSVESAKKMRTMLFLPPHPQRIAEGGLRKKGLFKHPNNEKSLISVITVVFNGEKYIEQAIQSIINQSYKNLEYIIIDGGSTDSTIEILQKYDDQIDYWISEPDLGIYDAMNKGTLLALGSHTLHINADDILFSHNSLEIDYKTNLNYTSNILIYFEKEQIFYKSLT
ncbi:MAG: glycosyltransferase, partial [Richelia sp. SL_2_1]|nr:glycosyltransferase [Richelia sp. SL_2_1]